jgi:hypothetical protein
MGIWIDVLSFLIIIYIINRASKVYKVIMHGITLLAMATDRIEKELGTIELAVDQTRSYRLSNNLDTKWLRDLDINEESSLLQKLELLLAAQADMSRRIEKIADPLCWKDGYLIVRTYESIDDEGGNPKYCTDADPKSPCFDSTEYLTEIDSDGRLYLKE